MTPPTGTTPPSAPPPPAAPTTQEPAPAPEPAPPTPTVRRRVQVSGRVQGVWFRGSTRREAARLGVAGWVRNRADGAVEAVLEGPAPAVAELTEWCRVGPPQARVDAVEWREEEPAGEEGFRVV